MGRKTVRKGEVRLQVALWAHFLANSEKPTRRSCDHKVIYLKQIRRHGKSFPKSGSTSRGKWCIFSFRERWKCFSWHVRMVQVHMRSVQKHVAAQVACCDKTWVLLGQIETTRTVASGTFWPFGEASLLGSKVASGCLSPSNTVADLRDKELLGSGVERSHSKDLDIETHVLTVLEAKKSRMRFPAEFASWQVVSVWLGRSWICLSLGVGRLRSRLLLFLFLLLLRQGFFSLENQI